MPNGVLNNCVTYIVPLNKKALKKRHLNSILMGYDAYEVGDTILLTKREFTNF